MALALIFYASLAGFALWTCWPNHDLRCVGFALIGSYLASNAVWFLGEPHMRPMIFSLCEVVIMAMAFLAWRAASYRSMVQLVIVSLISIGANIVFASIISPEPRQIFSFEVTTNLCFAAECLIATGTGIHERRWLDHIRARLRGRWHHPQPNVARRGKAP